MFKYPAGAAYSYADVNNETPVKSQYSVTESSSGALANTLVPMFAKSFALYNDEMPNGACPPLSSPVRVITRRCHCHDVSRIYSISSPLPTLPAHIPLHCSSGVHSQALCPSPTATRRASSAWTMAASLASGWCILCPSSPPAQAPHMAPTPPRVPPPSPLPLPPSLTRLL